MIFYEQEIQKKRYICLSDRCFKGLKLTISGEKTYGFVKMYSLNVGNGGIQVGHAFFSDTPYKLTSSSCLFARSQFFSEKVLKSSVLVKTKWCRLFRTGSALLATRYKDSELLREMTQVD